MTIQFIHFSKADKITTTDLKMIKIAERRYIFLKTVIKNDEANCYYRTSHIINFEDSQAIYNNIVSLVVKDNYIVLNKKE